MKLISDIRREYGQFVLKKLAEGFKIGINGLGVVDSRLPSHANNNHIGCALSVDL